MEADEVTEQNDRRKVALITGSSTGIGANIAIDLAVAGYTVILTGRDVSKLEKVVKTCGDRSKHGSDAAVAFQVDFYDLTQVGKLVSFIENKYDKLDLLINNVCWRGNSKNILDADTNDDLQRVMHMNVSIPFYLIHKCILMRHSPSREVVIINISSVASQVVVPLHMYSISKACLSELSRQIAMLKEDDRFRGISSVTISPGPVLTEERQHHMSMSKLTLLKRVGQTQEISDLVMFVLKNVDLMNGQEINIDGGYLARQIK